MKRTFTIACSVLVLTLLAGPALAHYVWESGFQWGADNKCMKLKTEISHGKQLNWGNGGAGGFSKDEIWTFQGAPLGGVTGCDAFPLPWDRTPGDIQTKIQLWSNDGFSGWKMCRHTHWHPLANDGNHKTQEAYWQRPCNRGWYKTVGGGIVGYNGVRNRRFLGSGMHYLGPSVDGSSKEIVPPQPAEPTWVNPDGSVNVEGMPDMVPVDGGGYVWSANLMGESNADLNVMDASGKIIGTFGEAGFAKGVPPVKHK